MSQATYKITAVNGDGRPWPKDEPKTVYFDVEVDGLGKAGLGLLPSDQPPQVGQEILCRLMEGKDGKPPTLYPAKNGRPGGGRSRDLSPEAQARIDATGRAQGRAHAQEMSLRYAQLKGKQDVSWDDLMKLADKFYDDAQAAKQDGYRGA